MEYNYLKEGLVKSTVLAYAYTAVPLRLRRVWRICCNGEDARNV